MHIRGHEILCVCVCVSVSVSIYGTVRYLVMVLRDKLLLLTEHEGITLNSSIVFFVNELEKVLFLLYFIKTKSLILA